MYASRDQVFPGSAAIFLYPILAGMAPFRPMIFVNSDSIEFAKHKVTVCLRVVCYCFCWVGFFRFIVFKRKKKVCRHWCKMMIINTLHLSDLQSDCKKFALSHRAIINSIYIKILLSCIVQSLLNTTGRKLSLITMH